MNLREKEEYRKQLEILLEALAMVPSDFVSDHTEAPLPALVNLTVLQTCAVSHGSDALALNVLIRAAKKLALEMKIGLEM